MEGMRIVVEGLLGSGANFEQFDWQPFRDGVQIARLYSVGTDGPSAALLRYAPGASVPSHRHLGLEHILVLAGSQEDEAGTYMRGTLLIQGADTGHRVASQEGCVVLAIWERPVEMSGGER
jgi:anti-sigma factor ChrR (cupin superfamily)